MRIFNLPSTVSPHLSRAAGRAYIQRDELKPLIERCERASFGDGKQTRSDTRVRDAYQLKADPRRFTVANFDPAAAGILAAVQQALVPHDPNPITAFDGGKLKLCHRGVVRDFDWGRIATTQTTPLELHWAAFFGDVEHQIERLWGGARVTLTYLLRRGAAGPQPSEPTADEWPPLIQDAWQALLADLTVLPQGGILGYPCGHLYHQDARFQCEQNPITTTQYTESNQTPTPQTAT